MNNYADRAVLDTYSVGVHAIYSPDNSVRRRFQRNASQSFAYVSEGTPCRLSSHEAVAWWLRCKTNTDAIQSTAVMQMTWRK